MATIDSLDIKISSSAQAAIKAIDSLNKKLGTLQKSLKIDTSGLEKLSNINGANIQKLGMGINSYSTAVKRLQGVKAGDFTRLANGMNKLASADIGRLQALSKIDFSMLRSLGVGAQSLASGLRALSGLKQADFNRLSKGIERLASIQPGNMQGLASVDFSRLGNSVRDFANAVSSAQKVPQSIVSLTSAVARLASAGGNVGVAATQLPQLGKALGKLTSSMSRLPAINPSVVSFTQSIASLANAGKKAGATAQNLGALGTGLKSLLTSLSTAPPVSRTTLQMVQAIASLPNSGRRASVSFTGLSKSVSSYGKEAEKSSKHTKSLGTQFAYLYAKIRTLFGSVRFLKNAIGSAMDYVETLNYFNAAFRQVAENADLSGWEKAGSESAEAYANSFRDRAKQLTEKMTGFEVSDTGELTRTNMPSLGLDPDKTMQYQATFAQMSSSMGATSEAAVKVSNALTMIGADLASVRNMDFDKVWEDMASGLAGMSRTLDKYGVNIRNVNLQQKLNSLGIDESITKINQQDKALLRTIILLESTRYAWGDLSKTINQPANQLRLLTANFQALSRTIGSLFIPTITKVLPYINAMVIALQRFFAWIAKLLGIKLSDFTASMGGISDSASGLLDGLDETGDLDGVTDSADKAADAVGGTTDSVKDLEKSLSVLSFDELNQLSAASKGIEDNISGAISTPDIGEDLNKIPDYSDILGSALDDALADYQAAWDKAFANMSNKANEIADKIVKAFKKIAKEAKPTTDAIKRLWNQGLKKLGDFTWDTIKDFWNNFLKPMGKWMLSDSSGLPRFFNITNDLLNKIDWGKLNKSLEEFFTSLQKPAKFVWTGLMDFYDHFLKPVAVWTMGEGIPQLVDALTEFNNTIHWEESNQSLKNFWDALAPFAISVGQGLVNFFKDLLSVGADFINKVVPGGLNSLADALRGIKPETAEKIGWALGELLTAILGFKAIGWIGKMIGEGSALGKGLSFLAKHPYLSIATGIGGVVLALDKFGVIDVDWDWLWSKLSQIKDILSEFIEKVDFSGLSDALGNLWSAFQPFAEGFADALIVAFDFFLNDIGVHLLNGLVDVFNLLAKALGKMDPNELRDLGGALAIIGISIKGIKIADKLITNLGLLQAGLINAGNAAATSRVNWAVLAKAIGLASAAMIGFKIGMDMTEVTTSTNADLDETSVHLSNFATVIGELGSQGKLTSDQQAVLNEKIDELTAKGASPVETLTVLRDALSQAGISSEDLANATSSTGTNLTDLIQILKDTESGGEATKRGMDSAKTATDEAKKSFGELASDAQKSTSILNETDLSPAKNTVKSLQDEVNKADYSHIPKETSDAVTETISTWNTNSGKIKNSVYDALYNNISSLGDALRRRFSGWAALSAKGYEDGIKNSTDETSKAMDFMVEHGIKSPFTAGLKMNSPSRLFAEYGGYTVSGFANGVRNNMKSATDSMDTLGSGIQRSIEGHLSSVETSADTTIGNLSRSFSTAETNANSSADRISRAFSGISIPLPHINFDWENLDFGAFSFSIPRFRVDWYAKGGLSVNPSIVGIGEAGPEAILPLTNAKVMSQIAESIYSNAPSSGIGMTKEEIKEAISEAVITVMMNNSANQPPVNVNCYATLKTENDEVLARAVARGRNSLDYRYSPA